jgi:hypothetical protein
MRSLARLAAAAALALCFTAPARAADYTDIWYIPAESGWGANVVQSDNFLFVTFFIYGADRKPTWYTAQLTRSGGSFTGPLFLTQGTYWALPWNPADSGTAQAVGTASFTPNALNTYDATLTWTVNGVGTVSKAITRQTLTSIALGGSYSGGQSGSYGNCSDSSQNGTYTDWYTLALAHTANNVATFTFNYSSGAVCTLSGTLEQHGKLYRIPGASYVCTGTLVFNTTATVYEIKATSLGVEGRFAASLPGSNCQENANFSAVLQ